MQVNATNPRTKSMCDNTKSMCDNEKTAGTPRIGALRTPSDCRRELARVYKLGRRGEIDTAHMTRFANVLQIMVGMIRDTELEERISRLEEHVSSRTGTPRRKHDYAKH